MAFLHSLRRRLADRIAPEASGDAGSRRDFFRQAGALGAGALGAGLLLPDDAWAGVEERASRAGIAPGTVVDAQGRPMASGGQFSDPFIGAIVMFGGNFAPRGWALCDGQLLAIASNSALFSILGTTFGGDGRTTFALPELRGRFPMHAGNGPGLTPRALGAKSGQESVTLATSEIPTHSHTLAASSAAGTTADPSGAVPATPASSIPQYAASGPGSMQPTGTEGGNQPHTNMPPFQAVNFIIALQGLFPSRS